MSSQLSEQIGKNSLDVTLNKIDSWSEQAVKQQANGLAVGPFSVIDLNNATASQPPAQIDNSIAFSDTPKSLETLNSLPDYLQWSDLFDLDFENYLASLPELSGLVSNSDENSSNVVSTSLLNQTGLSVNLPSPPRQVFDDQDLKNEASFLLRHFSEHVIPSIGALPFNTKSPYQILNVSAAVQTLADITYMERQIKHANAANLYGLLACSAYFLATNPSSPTKSNASYWADLASKAGAKAKEHMQKSLQFELASENKAKYKDQLMALMSNLAYSIAAGQQKDTRCYMVDTERLVRLRGLAKRHISRRSRLLHHMYTWSRIVGESTYVLHDLNSPPGAAPRSKRMITSETGHSSKLDDFLRLDHVDDDDFQSEEVKAYEVNLTDIHLQDPRLATETFYLQIYGIPETWLSLLSQTTRLANVKDMLKLTNNENTAMQNLLERRAARLEDMICSFAAKTDHGSAEATYLPPSQYMLRALSSALVIFYYRRIKHVNPWILQSHVDDVIIALRKFDESLTQQNLRGPGTAWPAFVAGCEAGPGSRRIALMEWVETAFWKTGSQSFKSAQEMMRETWTRRDQITTSPQFSRNRSTSSSSSHNPLTWVEICREKKEWVILC